MNIKEFNFDKLYHVTTIYNDKSKEELYEKTKEKNTEFIPNYELPNINEFHTKLDIPKWFTISQDDSFHYLSPWIGWNEVILEYNIIKPLKLLDLRDDEKYGSRKYFKYIHTNDSVDGYIGYEDVIEVYLKNAIDYLDKNYKIIYKN